jgi:hypothetical protein
MSCFELVPCMCGSFIWFLRCQRFLLHMALSANCVLIVFLSLDHRKLRTPTPESTVLHVGCLTRNVNEAHLKEIFGMYAEFFPIPMSSRQERVMECFFHLPSYCALLVTFYICCVLVWCRKLWGGCERGAGDGSLCKSLVLFFHSL